MAFLLLELCSSDSFCCTLVRRVARWQVALPSFRSPLLALVATFTSVICVLILPSTFVSREEKNENRYFPPYLPSVFPLGSSLRNHQRNATARIVAPRLIFKLLRFSRFAF